jgi:ubiquinone/menaquinone biosynthesis C-methylase UbiE
MGFYDRHILPRLIDFACGMASIAQQRAKLVPGAAGVVLEVGMGPGHNLPYYDSRRVERVIGLDPSATGMALARRRAAGLPFAVEFLCLEGESVPLADASVDTVVLTYTLCTIPDPSRALAQMRRVLKPGGRLLFAEHGRAPDPPVARRQALVNPVWRRLFGGCNLDRDIPGLLRAAGFRLDSLDTAYLPQAPRIAGFNYRGAAVADTPQTHTPTT